MKHCIITLMVCTLALNAEAQQKQVLAPKTKIFLHEQTLQPHQRPPGYVWVQDQWGDWRVKAFLKIDNSKQAALHNHLRSLQVPIGTEAGSVWTAALKPEQIQTIASLDGIKYLQLDEPIHMLMDSARRTTRVDSIHAGYGPTPLTWGNGKGVVVGIIDAGFDYRHPAFFDTTGTRYRVRRVWEQKNNQGTPPPGFTYGNEMTDSIVMWTKGYDMTISHGTHVAGIAAGSGFGGDSTNRQMRGMAYDADLVFVGITPSSQNWLSTGMTDVIDGMGYIYNYAGSVGKPAVANLSWGCSMGPHDGTSLFAQACDALTGTGKLFTVSAGNNGDEDIHVSKKFTATDTLLNTFISFDGSLPEKRAWLDVWGDSAKTFCISMSLYSSSTLTANSIKICLDDSLHDLMLIGNDGDTLFATVVTEASSFNGKPRVLIQLYCKTNNAINLTVYGSDGTVHGWNGYVSGTVGYYGSFSSAGFPWAQNGNSTYTLGDMATTRSAISVAAYASKNRFKNLAGNQVSYTNYVTRGAIAPFSSKGPVVGNAFLKPDIAGPGLTLASAVNSYDPSVIPGGSSANLLVAQYQDPGNNRNYYYGQFMGTSMSSPAVAGIVALMMQWHPLMLPNEAQDYLHQSAIKDNFTTSNPDSTIWGAGKVNAMGAYRLLPYDQFVPGLPNDQKSSMLIYPNPVINHQFTIKYQSVAFEAMHCTIFTTSGLPVWSGSWQSSVGVNEQSISTNLIDGTYIVQLKSASLREKAVMIIRR